jgi:poly-gamma-glutamate synthesis protein (capsule biosynthesis protein)
MLLAIAAAVIAVAAFAISKHIIRANEPLAAAVGERVENYDIPVTHYRNTYSSPQQFMEGIYAADHRAADTGTGTIRAVIVPHHLVASEDDAVAIKALAGQTITSIILISPDHYDKCPTALCTTNGDYETFFGHTHASPAIVKDLVASALVTNAPGLFDNEHGIYAVAPFLAHYLPGISVTPLAVRIDYRRSNKEMMLKLLQAEMKEGTVFIVSSDFSHYLPYDEAEKMDALTKAVLASGDLDGMETLKDPSQSDCPACLWLLGSLAKNNNFYRPDFLMHTNSAALLKDLTVKQTTSHFAIIWR